MTPLELIETYPEALTIVKRNLALWRKYKREVMPLYDKCIDIGIDMWISSGVNDDIIKANIEDWHEFIMKRLPKGPKEIDGHIKRLQYLSSLYERVGKPIGTHEITERDIALAKEVPIPQYLPLTRSGFVSCPFHNEKTPSAKYYPDKNKIFCFGCQKSADAIDVVMQLYGLEFLAAVTFMIRK